MYMISDKTDLIVRSCKRVGRHISVNKKPFFVIAALFGIITISTILRWIGYADLGTFTMSVMWTVAVYLVLFAVADYVSNDKFFTIVFNIGFWIRILFIIAFFTITAVAMRTSNDANSYFFPFSKELYETGSGPYANEWPYLHLLNFQYHIYGYNAYIVYLVETALSISTFFLIWKFAETVVANTRITKVLSLLFVFSPFYMAIQSSGLRETWYVISACIICWLVYKWIHGGGISCIILSLALVVFVAILKSANIVWGIPIIILAIVYDNKNRRFRIRAGVALACCGILFLLVVFMWNRISGYVDTLTDSVIQATNITSEYIGGSTYLVGIRYDGVGSVILYTPIRMVYYLFSPMPWNWRNLTDVGAFVLNSSVHLCYFAMFIKCLINHRGRTRDKDRAFVIFTGLVVLLAAFVYAWGTQNAGTALRHRDNLVAMEMMCILFCSGGVYRGYKI